MDLTDIGDTAFLSVSPFDRGNRPFSGEDTARGGPRSRATAKDSCHCEDSLDPTNSHNTVMHTPDMRSKNALDGGYHRLTVLRTHPGLRSPRQHAYAEPMHPTRALPSGSDRRRRSGAPQHHLARALGTVYGSMTIATCE